METIEAILKEISINIPEVLINNELHTMTTQFRHDISRMGMKFDEYLKYIKKSEEDLKKEWRTDAESRVKTQLLVAKIANAEKIKPDEERVKFQTKQLLDQQKGSGGKDMEMRARMYVEMVLTNEAVFGFLENL